MCEMETRTTLVIQQTEDHQVRSVTAREDRMLGWDYGAGRMGGLEYNSAEGTLPSSVAETDVTAAGIVEVRLLGTVAVE